MELQILASGLASRSAYELIKDYVSEDTLSPAARTILKHVDDYYANDIDTNSVDYDVLQAALLRSTVTNKQQSMKDTLGRIRECDVSLINVVQEVVQHKLECLGQEISLSLSMGDSTKTSARTVSLMDEYQAVVTRGSLFTEDVDSNQELDIDALFDASVRRNNLIRIAPKPLNDFIGGGLEKKESVVVFGNVESGKTTFVVNMMRGFLSDGHTVLYCGNEDPLKKVMRRLVCSISGASEIKVSDNLDKVKQIVKKRGIDCAVLKELSPGTLAQIRQLVVKHKPDIVIVDQVKNIHVNSDKADAGVMQGLAILGIRNIAKQYDLLTVCVTQAGDRGFNRLNLNANDVHGARVDVGAQADLMIGIGVNEQFRQMNMRRATISKNKVNGKLGYVDMNIDTVTGRYS